MEQIRVAVQAVDPITEAGLTGLLRSHAGLDPLPADQADAADVLVVLTDRLNASVVARLRRAATDGDAPVVLIADEVSETELITVIECRVVAVLPRAAVTAERLARAVVAAVSGGGVMPPHLVGELLKHIDRIQREVLAPNGLHPASLNQREIDVLRLMADGLDTKEVAEQLRYSERTVKNVVYAVTQRLNLRNRSHAIAYALRTGMI